LSANFGHLQEISPELHRLGTLAERFFAEDANTSLIKSRQFGEYMVKEIAALSGVYDPAARETTNDLLRRLATQQVLPREVADIFHAVRKSGNDATHNLAGSPAEALAALKFCRALGVWYRRTYGRDPGFKPGLFVPPRASADIDQATQAELTALRAQVREAAEKLAAAHASAEDLAKARAAAEELARQA
jgi:type I restriction enzyme R subunit